MAIKMKKPDFDITASLPTYCKLAKTAGELNNLHATIMALKVLERYIGKALTNAGFTNSEITEIVAHEFELLHSSLKAVEKKILFEQIGAIEKQHPEVKNMQYSLKYSVGTPDPVFTLVDIREMSDRDKAVYAENKRAMRELHEHATSVSGVNDMIEKIDALMGDAPGVKAKAGSVLRSILATFKA